MLGRGGKGWGQSMLLIVTGSLFSCRWGMVGVSGGRGVDGVGCSLVGGLRESGSISGVDSCKCGLVSMCWGLGMVLEVVS